MKIWIFNHYVTSPSLPGGTRHIDFGKELVKRGHEVTIFASSFNYSLRRETQKYEKRKCKTENIEGVTVVWIKTPPYKKNDWRRFINMLSYSYRAQKIAKSIGLGKPDIIIGSSAHLFAVYAGHAVAKYFNIPYVMEIRDVWPQALVEMGMSKLNPAIIIMGILEKYLYKKADGIITLLPRSHRHIEKRGGSSEKITWIGNGADMTKFQNDIRPREKLVRYIGSIGKPNNVRLLVEAAGLLPDAVRMEIIGDGTEKKRLSKNAPKNVYFLKTVPRNNVPRLLEESDIVAITMHKRDARHGVSMNKIYDALAAGRPILYACDTVNNPIEDAKAGITAPPDDPQKVADAIKTLLALSEEEKTKMGRRGREYVEKYHSIPVLVDKLEKVLNSVTSPK